MSRSDATSRRKPVQTLSETERDDLARTIAEAQWMTSGSEWRWEHISEAKRNAWRQSAIAAHRAGYSKSLSDERDVSHIEAEALKVADILRDHPLFRGSQTGGQVTEMILNLVSVMRGSQPALDAPSQLSDQEPDPLEEDNMIGPCIDCGRDADAEVNGLWLCAQDAYEREMEDDHEREIQEAQRQHDIVMDKKYA